MFTLRLAGTVDRWAVVPLAGGLHSAVEVQEIRAGDGEVSRVMLFRRDGGVDSYLQPGDEGVGSRALVRGLARQAAGRPPGRTVLGTAGLGCPASLGFPLVLCEDTRFWPAGSVSLELTVEGHRCGLRAAPVFGDGEPLDQVRSGGRTVRLDWNPGEVGPLEAVPTGDALDRGVYFTSDRSGHPEIRRVEAADGSAVMRFDPAFPDLSGLVGSAWVGGRFAVGTRGEPRVMEGRYEVTAGNASVEVRLFPDRAWQPFAGNPWVATWAWTGTLSRGPGGWTFSSHWDRIGGWGGWVGSLPSP